MAAAGRGGGGAASRSLAERRPSDGPGGRVRGFSRSFSSIQTCLTQGGTRVPHLGSVACAHEFYEPQSCARADGRGKSLTFCLLLGLRGGPLRARTNSMSRNRARAQMAGAKLNVLLANLSQRGCAALGREQPRSLRRTGAFVAQPRAFPRRVARELRVGSGGCDKAAGVPTWRGDGPRGVEQPSCGVRNVCCRRLARASAREARAKTISAGSVAVADVSFSVATCVRDALDDLRCCHQTCCVFGLSRFCVGRCCGVVASSLYWYV